jgi:hypothetical protein
MFVLLLSCLYLSVSHGHYVCYKHIHLYVFNINIVLLGSVTFFNVPTGAFPEAFTPLYDSLG